MRGASRTAATVRVEHAPFDAALTVRVQAGKLHMSYSFALDALGSMRHPSSIDAILVGAAKDWQADLREAHRALQVANADA